MLSSKEYCIFLRLFTKRQEAIAKAQIAISHPSNIASYTEARVNFDSYDSIIKSEFDDEDKRTQKSTDVEIEFPEWPYKIEQQISVSFNDLLQTSYSIAIRISNVIYSAKQAIMNDNIEKYFVLKDEFDFLKSLLSEQMFFQGINKEEWSTLNIALKKEFPAWHYKSDAQDAINDFDEMSIKTVPFFSSDIETVDVAF